MELRLPPTLLRPLARPCRKPLPPPAAHPLSTSAPLRSGHSKWSKIKHDKAITDARKNKHRNVLARDIATASRFSGPDPATNPTLAAMIAKAKQAGMQKGTIEAAILRGQGKSASGAALEAVQLEAVLPPVALLIEAETDKKGQLLQELRALLKAHGGTATPTEYMFARRGRVSVAPAAGVGVEEVLEAVLEAGALDVAPALDGGVVVETEPAALKAVEAALAERFGVPPESAETVWVANEETAVARVEEAAADELDRLVDKIEEYPGVEGVYHNLRAAPS